MTFCVAVVKSELLAGTLDGSQALWVLVSFYWIEIHAPMGRNGRFAGLSCPVEAYTLLSRASEHLPWAKHLYSVCFYLNLCPVNINFWSMIWVYRKKRPSAIKKSLKINIFSLLLSQAWLPLYLLGVKLSLPQLLRSGDGDTGGVALCV